jgi:hypothetical protein
VRAEVASAARGIESSAVGFLVHGVLPPFCIGARRGRRIWAGMIMVHVVLPANRRWRRGDSIRRDRRGTGRGRAEWEMVHGVFARICRCWWGGRPRRVVPNWCMGSCLEFRSSAGLER